MQHGKHALKIGRISVFAMIGLILLGAVSAGHALSDTAVPEKKHAPPTFGVFTNPEPVTIEGYSADAMEPFISPDGNYLFFNDSNSLPQTNLYYATRIDDVTFQFQGEIGGANATGLNAVASMDVNNTFYFVSTRSYSETLSTIYWGIFSDGSTLYFVDGVFNGGSVPEAASIAIAKRRGNHFKRIGDSAKIMRKINTDGLNYAPDISKSGLEFFFTRIEGTPPTPPPVIYTATRASTSEPFGTPSVIEAITGFAEAPALSPDEKSLYYHEQVNGTFVIFRVTRQ